MKYCMGKFHGSVQKQIEDSENYCLLCNGRYLAEKEAKKEKTKEIIKNVATVVVSTVGSFAAAALGSAINKNSDSQ